MPRRITVKGFSGTETGSAAKAGAMSNGHVSAADTGSEMDDEGSEVGAAQRTRNKKRRLERHKAAAGRKPAQKGKVYGLRYTVYMCILPKSWALLPCDLASPHRRIHTCILPPFG